MAYPNSYDDPYNQEGARRRVQQPANSIRDQADWNNSPWSAATNPYGYGGQQIADAYQQHLGRTPSMNEVGSHLGYGQANKPENVSYALNNIYNSPEAAAYRTRAQQPAATAAAETPPATAPPATPAAPTVGAFTSSMGGFEASRLANLEDQKPKYVFGRLASQYAPTPENVRKIVEELKKTYPQSEWNGGDQWRANPGDPWQDIMRDYGGPNAQWTFTNAGGSAPLTNMVQAPPVTPTGMPAPPAAPQGATPPAQGTTPPAQPAPPTPPLNTTMPVEPVPAAATYQPGQLGGSPLPTYDPMAFSQAPLPTYQAARFDATPLPTYQPVSAADFPTYQPGQLPSEALPTYRADQLPTFLAPNQTANSDLEQQVLQRMLLTPGATQGYGDRLKQQNIEDARANEQQQLQQMGTQYAARNLYGGGQQGADERRVRDATSEAILRGNRTVDLQTEQMNRVAQAAAVQAAEEALTGQMGRATAGYGASLAGGQAQAAVNQAAAASQQERVKFALQQALAQEQLRQAAVQSGQAATQFGAQQGLQAYQSQAAAREFLNNLQRQQADEQFRAYGTTQDASRFAREGQQLQANEAYRGYTTQADASRFALERALAQEQLRQQAAASSLSGYQTSVNRALAEQQLRQQQQQFGQDVGLRRELGMGDIGLRRELGQGDLSLRQQLGMGNLGLDTQRLGEQGREFDLSHALAQAQLAQQGSQFGQDLQYRYGNTNLNSYQDFLNRLFPGRR